MLNYLMQKKADLEAQKVETQIIYPDLDAKVEEYRKELYTARDAEITEQNKLIDAKVSVLEEVIEETERAIEEAEKEAETVEAVEATETEQKEVVY